MSYLLFHLLTGMTFSNVFIVLLLELYGMKKINALRLPFQKNGPILTGMNIVTSVISEMGEFMRSVSLK